MSLFEIFENLYSSDLIQTLETINQSIYAPDFTNKEKDLIIHTGFTFEIHNGKKMELLYAVLEKKLIRQLRFDSNSLPCIAGLACEYNGFDYIKQYYANFIFYGATPDGTMFLDMETNEQTLYSSHLSHNSFIIYKKEDNQISTIKEFPLAIHLQKILYFKNSWFYMDRPYSHHDDDESYYEESDFNEKNNSSTSSWRDAENELRSWDRDYPGWSWGRGGG